MKDVLDQVENRHPVADWREEVGSIGVKEQVSLTIDGPQQVGELGYVSSWRITSV